MFLLSSGFNKTIKKPGLRVRRHGTDSSTLTLRVFIYKVKGQEQMIPKGLSMSDMLSGSRNQLGICSPHAGLPSLISETKNDEIRAFGLEAQAFKLSFSISLSWPFPRFLLGSICLEVSKGGFGRSPWVTDWMRIHACFICPERLHRGSRIRLESQGLNGRGTGGQAS